MRAFVGIPAPDGWGRELHRLISGMKGGRAVPAENWHVTLVFLGDVSAAVIDELHGRIEGLRWGPAELIPEGLGHFGDPVRSIHVGLKSEAGLVRLQAKLERIARETGIAVPKRRFAPHLTLARFREGPEETAAAMRHLAGVAPERLEPATVRGMALYSSYLGPDGAEYDQLASYPVG